MKKTLLILLAFLSTFGAAFAQETIDPNLSDARYLRLSGRPDLANSLLQDLVEKSPRNTAYRYELGVTEAEMGKCATASRHFKQAEILSPSQRVSQAVDAAMIDLCPRLAKWDFQGGLTIIADDNYNNSTQSEFVDIFGARFDLSPDARAQKRTGVSLHGYAGYNQPIGDNAYIVPSLGVRTVFLDEQEDNRYHITPGIALRLRGDRSNFSIGPFSTFEYDNEGKRSRSTGVSTSYSRDLSASSSMSFNASYARVSHEVESENGDNISLSASYSKALDQNRLITLVVAHAQDNKQLDYRSLENTRISGFLSGEVSQGIGYEIGASLGRISAQGQDPFFMRQRQDNYAEVSAGISFAKYETFVGRPSLSVIHTISSSNIELHDYTKTRINFGFERRF